MVFAAVEVFVAVVVFAGEHLDNNVAGGSFAAGADFESVVRMFDFVYNLAFYSKMTICSPNFII